MANSKKVLVGLFLFFSVTVFAQEGPETPQTLEKQFNSMIEEAETFKNYKVIKIEQLNNFWATVEDSLENKENEIAAAEEKINEQQNNIAELKDEMASDKAMVEQAEYDREHITVLGIDFMKSTFILISFLVVVALLALIAYGYGKYKYSTRLATDKSKSYDKLEQEYKDYQDKARESQMKLKRELQTQVNKIEELKHKNISFK
ncbi:MAG: hypothetical protein ACNS60_05345 [Candidatus Cyclobacteriaceae bacterium M2_1C_046]